MKNNLISVMVLVFVFNTGYCQDSVRIISSSNSEEGRGGRPTTDYKPIYFIGEDANICYKSNLVAQESILFEANPIVRFSLSNNIHRNLLNARKTLAHALYIAFEPQLRMYIDNSFPVKMPSYRVQLGYQKLFRLKNDDFLAIALESGHYSNGQSGCAFSTTLDDGSAGCEAIYNSITPETNLSDILNRQDANFSTNYTDLFFNYRIHAGFDEDHDFPNRIHSLLAGFTLFNDRFWGLFSFGGYSDQDIKLYGRMRYQLGYEYINVGKGPDPTRFSISTQLEIIGGAHPHVNPWRNVLSFSYFPIRRFKEFGFFTSYIYGHDNYNFRFVDQGHQVAFGLVWSKYVPGQIKRNL